MDTKTNTIPFIIGSLVVVGAIAFGAYAFTQKDTMVSEGDLMHKEEGMMKDETAPMEKKDAGTQVDGTVMEKGATEGDAMSKEDTMKEEGVMMQKGSYETYAPEKLALAETGDVVLFFHASWCPSCRGLDADITKNLGAIPEGVTILKVDYDKEVELKKKYGVTYQHTLVLVDAEGNQIKKWSGGSSLASLVGQIP